jgi:hypothetical protein
MTPNGFFTGCVENRDDPLKLGRCQVRIVGLHTEDKTILPVADLPWAFPISPITSANTSGVGQTPLGPVEGTWVFITFMDPDCQIPMMLGTLGGVAQIPNATDDPGKLKIENTNPDGTVSSTTDGTSEVPFGTSSGSTAAAKPPDDGKLVTGKDAIVGPLANLIAKAESGTKGYNAFNRGTAGGKIVGGGEMNLTDMTIKDIMAKQCLPPSDPNKLFAVGKYQCIPVTLSAACQALNINTDQKFTPQIQDIICQEYLVGKKRPKLMAYYRNPDKNSDTLLKEAGKSLAAEFASIEDPYYLGYPYGGPSGTYYKSGNKVGTKWESIKATLIKEWEFRNSKTAPPPTASLGGNDKVDKGTDYTGVAKNVPLDTSTKTGPTPSVTAASSGPTVPVPDIVPTVPGLDALNAATGLGGLGIPSDILSAVSSLQNQFKELTSSLNLDGALTDVLGSLKGAQADLLSSFGGSLNEITSNLGIENPSGSVGGLFSELGIAVPSQDALVKELTKIAGSPAGQAKAMLAKLQTEPTKPEALPMGQKNPDGSISNGTTVDPTKGFQDPNGTYPKYKNEQDTNRLASGNNIGRTIVLEKEAALKQGIKIANGGTWDQSPVPYNAKYPYNHVKQTESGHVEEFDDTPGNERIHVYHKSGTFTETDVNGTTVNRIVGDGFEILERNGFIYVKGAYSVTVDGAMNLRTDNVFNLEVSGSTNINIYSNAHINVSGDTELAVGGSLSAKAGKINLESEGQFNIKAGTGLHVQAGSDIHVYGEASMFTETAGNIHHKAAGVINAQSDSDINFKSTGLFNIESENTTNIKAGTAVNVESAEATNIKAGSDTNIESGSQLSLKASGTVALDGAEFDMQNGSSNSADSAEGAEDAKGAEEAESIVIELPVETRGGSGTAFLPPLAVPTRGSEVGYDAPSTGDYASYSSARVSNNQTSASEVSASKFEQERATPNAKPSTVPVGSSCDVIYKTEVMAFTAGMKLSKYFTLGDLTAGGQRIPRNNYVIDGVTVTPQEIICNLKGLAENLLDPIADKYGKDSFVITSAFRRPPVGNQPGDLGLDSSGQPRKEGGDHPRGCAADLAFKAGKAEMYKIAQDLVKMLPTWNQIILEYDGNKTWIHCAFKYSGNKGNYFTMNSHKTYGGTFPNGGFILT